MSPIYQELPPVEVAGRKVVGRVLLAFLVLVSALVGATAGLLLVYSTDLPQVNELEHYNGRPTGAVSAFAIARDTGALTRLNEQPSGGGAPCFMSVDKSGRVALVANYAGGSVALLPIQANGALAPAMRVVQHTGKGPNAERQEAPHAHCILPDPSNRFALAADLGVDRVYVYRLDVDGKTREAGRAKWPPMAPTASRFPLPSSLATPPRLPHASHRARRSPSFSADPEPRRSQRRGGPSLVERDRG